MKTEPTQFSKKDLIDFGNYLLSDKRIQLVRDHPEKLDNALLKERLREVSHADFENWLESLKKNYVFYTDNRGELIKEFETIAMDRIEAFDNAYQIYGHIANKWLIKIDPPTPDKPTP